MSINLRYPDFAAPGITDPVKGIQSYLIQMVDELNFALVSVENTAEEAKTVAAVASSSGSSEKAAESTFNAIKSLIIKSADIVNAYYEQINKRLSGVYVAESDFGTYKEETTTDIEANSKEIKLVFSNLQDITTDIGTLEQARIDTDAHINSGLLFYDDAGVPVYGLEVGQRTEIDGKEVFNKYARFTADKLSFYDSNGKEVAYISDKKLYITHIEVIVSFTRGGLMDTVLADGSVVTK